MTTAGPRLWTNDIIQERKRIGHGQGLREYYLPWLLVQEYASSSNQTRVPCAHFPRTIHTFSILELLMFIFLEWNGFEDYREQFPLPRDLLIPIAIERRLPYPVYRKTRVPVVMTLDALVTLRTPGAPPVLQGWDAKPTDKLEVPGVKAALELHRAFCEEVGIEHKLFTEKSHDRNMLLNILWARGARPIHGETPPTPDFFTTELERFYDWLCARDHEHPVFMVCSAYDQMRKFPIGTTLRLFRLLVWQKRLVVDMNQPELHESFLPKQSVASKPHGSANRDGQRLHQRRA